MTRPAFLLDTNIFSEVTKPQPNPHVLAKLHQHRLEIATASVVLHELLWGCYRLPPSKKRQKLEQYIITVVALSVPILSYTEQAAQWHAKERVRLESIGRVPPYVDSQIAAIAVVNRLTLVTRNQADYQNFQDLKLENWFR